MAVKKVTGLADILVNGVLLLNKANATISGIGISGQPAFKRVPVLGDGGVHGFTEEPIVARTEVTITDREDQSLSALAALNQDGTVIFRAKRGGKAYIMNQATAEGDFELTAGEGETRVAFIGPYWTEYSD